MAKKSRRQRKAETAKAISTPSATPSQNAVKQQVQAVVAQADDTSGSMAQKAVTFAQDYHYVYTDIRILAVVTILAIILMFGLSFVV